MGTIIGRMLGDVAGRRLFGEYRMRKIAVSRSALLLWLSAFAVAGMVSGPWVVSAAGEDGDDARYVKFSTGHFDVELDASAAEYRPYVETYLELGYRLFQKYTRYDYNEMMNKVAVKEVHKPRYFYQLPRGAHMWQKGFGGGLTYWNNSQMNVNLVPRLAEEKLRADQVALSILWHELANGWANVYVSHAGKPTHVPAWFGAEGHAGFLRNMAMREIGYPQGQVQEYQRAVASFDKYLAGEPHDPGGVCHVFMESIWQAHGWKPLRAVYDAIQQQGVRFPEDDPPRANGMVIALMSKAVGESLIPLFEANRVPVDERTREELKGLPATKMKIARKLWLPEAFAK